MITTTPTAMFRRIANSGWRIVRWAAMNAIIGTVCGAFFGIVFGGFAITIDRDPSRIIPITEYFAVCGAVAGALVGTCAAVLDAEQSRKPAISSPEVAKPVRAPAQGAGKIETAGESLPRNRPSQILDTGRRRKETRASFDPSRN
jgi:hypothetical protein